PVRIENRRQIDKFRADKSRERQNDRRKRKRDRRYKSKLRTANDKQRRNTRAERKCQAQIIKIRERNVSENPGHLRKVLPLLRKYLELAVKSGRPTHEP